MYMSAPQVGVLPARFESWSWTQKVERNAKTKILNINRQLVTILAK